MQFFTFLVIVAPTSLRYMSLLNGMVLDENSAPAYTGIVPRNRLTSTVNSCPALWWVVAQFYRGPLNRRISSLRVRRRARSPPAGLWPRPNPRSWNCATTWVGIIGRLSGRIRPRGPPRRPLVAPESAASGELCDNPPWNRRYKQSAFVGAPCHGTSRPRSTRAPLEGWAWASSY